jgi:hypothetical protein
MNIDLHTKIGIEKMNWTVNDSLEHSVCKKRDRLKKRETKCELRVYLLCKTRPAFKSIMSIVTIRKKLTTMTRATIPKNIEEEIITSTILKTLF